MCQVSLFGHWPNINFPIALGLHWTTDVRYRSIRYERDAFIDVMINVNNLWVVRYYRFVRKVALPSFQPKQLKLLNANGKSSLHLKCLTKQKYNDRIISSCKYKYKLFIPQTVYNFSRNNIYRSSFSSTIWKYCKHQNTI